MYFIKFALNSKTNNIIVIIGSGNCMFKFIEGIYCTYIHKKKLGLLSSGHFIVAYDHHLEAHCTSLTHFET